MSRKASCAPGALPREEPVRGEKRKKNGPSRRLTPEHTLTRSVKKGLKVRQLPHQNKSMRGPGHKGHRSIAFKGKNKTKSERDKDAKGDTGRKSGDPQFTRPSISNRFRNPEGEAGGIVLAELAGVALCASRWDIKKRKVAPRGKNSRDRATCEEGRVQRGGAR